MANISKPANINQIWSSGGDILKPSDSKIAQGWTAEIPPRQWFNWDQNRKDQAIAHINQHGIPVWDAVTEYQANSSYTKGSDGRLYFCTVTNTNKDPVTDRTSWQPVLAPSGIQRFTANGNFTVPSGVQTVYVTAIGGGGGGGGGAGYYNGGSAGAGGGGAGRSAIKVPVQVTPGSIIPVTIGSAGVRGTGGGPGGVGQNGGNGGTTSFGTFITLAGGGGGTAGGVNNGGKDGGVGGSGGGSYGTDGVSILAGTGGTGGSSPLGTAGGSGRGGSSGGQNATEGFGFGAGGGGGGGSYGSGTSGGNGSNGLPGILIVEW